MRSHVRRPLTDFRQHVGERGGWVADPFITFSELDQLYSVPLHGQNVDRDEFYGAFEEAFRAAVSSAIERTGSMVIMHSSGYDSRNLGNALLNLDKIGDAYFVCMAPEGKQFHDIMDYYGVDASRRLVVYRSGNYEDRDSCIRENDFALTVRVALENFGLKEGESAVWSCGYCNETLQYGFFERYRGLRDTLRDPLRDWIIRYYFCAPYAKNAAECGVEMVYPILDPRVLRVMLGSNIVLNESVRQGVVREANPELFSFPRYQDVEG